MDINVWDRSSVWSERLPVTQEVAGSSPVGPGSFTAQFTKTEAPAAVCVCRLEVVRTGSFAVAERLVFIFEVSLKSLFKSGIFLFGCVSFQFL
jgi:hypothetical protein